ncbi:MULTISPECIES: flavin reductase [unclassified Desulfovibrio]|uniref:flavin reductase n=1 Tax=unclassified Desulfovibrio TaxID=2593640 RepID=UPI0013EA43E5|nr:MULTISPECIES: flavin reductase [unclassified Desulfovibrio]
MKKWWHLVLCLAALSMPLAASQAQGGETAMEKINIGKKLALYPSVVTVVGAEVKGKVNWLTVAHTGTIGHNMILVSMSQSHYTNQGIIESGKLSLNLVERHMLPQVDYVGTVSGANADKSGVFAWHRGENGSPLIAASPVSIELNVVDNYKAGGFDNFICTIANTYARKDVLDATGKLDYHVLKPVLFEFPTYSYLATGEMLGKCRQYAQKPSMGAKLPMTESGITRLSRIEVDPQYLEEYKKFAAEVGETSLRTEPGVLTMYAVADKKNPCRITILETYASKEAYEKHIASPHFQKYKQGTQKMVKELVLDDQVPLNENNRLTNYMVIPY